STISHWRCRMTGRTAWMLFRAVSISVAVVAAGVVGVGAAWGVVLLGAQPATITSGTSTDVAWSTDGNVSLTPKDWIGLYASPGAADGAFLAWRYTDSTLSSASMPFLVP